MKTGRKKGMLERTAFTRGNLYANKTETHWQVFQRGNKKAFASMPLPQYDDCDAEELISLLNQLSDWSDPTYVHPSVYMQARATVEGFAKRKERDEFARKMRRFIRNTRRPAKQQTVKPDPRSRIGIIQQWNDPNEEQ